MIGYEYGNTRLRAMKSRLLTQSQMKSLSECGSIDQLTIALSKTAYRQSVAHVLSRQHGIAGFSDVLNHNIRMTIGKIPSFYRDQPARLIEILFWRYDIQNLKAVLRGLSQQFPAPDIMQAVVPVGVIPPGVMVKLAQAANPHIAVDLLATMGFPFARPLLALRAVKPGAGIPAHEMALERWACETMRDHLSDGDKNVRILRRALDIETDVANLIAVLHAIETGARSGLPASETGDMFIGPGTIHMDVLKKIALSGSIEEAIEYLADTPYHAPLTMGLGEYRQQHLLSKLEHQLKRYSHGWQASQLVKDPMGIGVPLGYLAYKENELRILRQVALFTHLGFESEDIMLGVETFL